MRLNIYLSALVFYIEQNSSLYQFPRLGITLKGGQFT